MKARFLTEQQPVKVVDTPKCFYVFICLNGEKKSEYYSSTENEKELDDRFHWLSSYVAMKESEFSVAKTVTLALKILIQIITNTIIFFFIIKPLFLSF